MTTRVIELNDSAIGLGDAAGIIVQSPGFALVDGKLVQMGEEAERQARLKPTSSYNKYWHELSLEPLTQQSQFRHAADIAHAHLLHLAEEAELSGSDNDVIFAVPGNFSQQQLAILLGISGQTPFRPVGVADSALAAAIAMAEAENIIYIDMQLHQVVLTELQLRDEHIATASVVQIPGVGSQNFMDLMMQLSTELFIQQSRFNPQHNAESEQQLYNALPAWLQQEETEGSLQLELNSSGNVYTAKMPRETLIQSLAGHYKKIEQQIQALNKGTASQILLNPRIAAMPGFRHALRHQGDLLIVPPGTVHKSCLEYSEAILGGEKGIHRVSTLPVKAEHKAAMADRSSSAESPTHLLFEHRAFPLDGLRVTNKPQVNGSRSSSLNLALEGLPDELGLIERRGNGLFLQALNGDWRVNEETVTDERQLTLGDRLRIADKELSVIRVNHG